MGQQSIASIQPAWEDLPNLLPKQVVKQTSVCVFPEAKVTDMKDFHLEPKKQYVRKLLQDIQQYPHESQTLILPSLKLYNELKVSKSLQSFWLKLYITVPTSYPLITKDLADQFLKLTEISLKRSRAISRLIGELQHLPNLAKSSHQNYSDALSLTWDYVSRNIHLFKQPPFGLEQSLTTWINGYLKWRIKDLYTDDKKYRDKLPLAEAITTERVLIKTKTESGSNTPPNLDGLDDYIRALQGEHKQKLAQSLEDYVKTDPDRKLKSLHPKATPACNCQLLTQRLFFQDPPDRIRNIAKEFSLNEQSLYSHWKKKCLPCLQGLAEEFGYGKEV
jgi:hypothetical protein